MLRLPTPFKSFFLALVWLPCFYGATGGDVEVPDNCVCVMVPVGPGELEKFYCPGGLTVGQVIVYTQKDPERYELIKRFLKVNGLDLKGSGYFFFTPFTTENGSKSKKNKGVGPRTRLEPGIYTLGLGSKETAYQNKEVNSCALHACEYLKKCPLSDDLSTKKETPHAPPLPSPRGGENPRQREDSEVEFSSGQGSNSRSPIPPPAIAAILLIVIGGGVRYTMKNQPKEQENSGNKNKKRVFYRR